MIQRVKMVKKKPTSLLLLLVLLNSMVSVCILVVWKGFKSVATILYNVQYIY